MISKDATKEIVEMVTAFPVPENERNAQALLRTLIEHGHMDQTAVAGRTIFSVVLEDWQVDLLSCYGAERDDREDCGDEEEEGAMA